MLPLTYERVPEIFGAVALVGIVLAVMTTGVIHLALNSVREHRRRLKFLIDATASFDTSLDPAEALRNLARAAVPELAELCVIDLIGRDGIDRRRPLRRRWIPTWRSAWKTCARTNRWTWPATIRLHSPCPAESRW